MLPAFRVFLAAYPSHLPVPFGYTQHACGVERNRLGCLQTSCRCPAVSFDLAASRPPELVDRFLKRPPIAIFPNFLNFLNFLNSPTSPAGGVLILACQTAYFFPAVFFALLLYRR